MSEPYSNSAYLAPINPTTDAALVAWVHSANQTDSETGVTLQMHGLLVSGTLISARKYGTLVGELLDAGRTGTEEGMSWKKVFNAETLTGQPDNQLPSFIHLTNVVFVQIPGLEPLRERIVWRGRLRDVDAWWFGHIQK